MKKKKKEKLRALSCPKAMSSILSSYSINSYKSNEHFV